MVQLLNETKDMKQQFLEFNFNAKMDTTDMSDYFPLKCDADINRFLRHNDELNQRKKVRSGTIFFAKWSVGIYAE